MGETDLSVFPTFLKLGGRKTVVVGGGPVAASKLDALLAAGARVTVVSPQVRDEMRRPRVRIVLRPFEPTDLDEAWFVVAAAPPDVNREVAEAASARRIFVNAVDDPQHASAYLGGVVRRGGVTVAISTDGAAPALAGLLREGLAAVLPRDLGRWMREARWRRREWRARNVPMAERRPLLLDALVRLYADRPFQSVPVGSGLLASGSQAAGRPEASASGSQAPSNGESAEGTR